MERFLVLGSFGFLVYFGQESHLHCGGSVVQAGVLALATGIVFFVEFDILHPTAAILLVVKQPVSNLLCFFTTIPVGRHLARTDF